MTTMAKEAKGKSGEQWLRLPGGIRRPLTQAELRGAAPLPVGAVMVSRPPKRGKA